MNPSSDAPATPANTHVDVDASPSRRASAFDLDSGLPAAPGPFQLGRRALLLLGAVPVFVIMASVERFAFSVPVGFLGCLAAALGVLHCLGALPQTSAAAETRRVELAAIGPRAVELLAAGVVLVAVLRLAVAGVLPWPRATAAILVTSSFSWLLVAGYRVLDTLGVWENTSEAPRSLLLRHGFWLLVLTSLLYVPLLGSFSLSDPWETHYGEVAREMLARDDWISLWWAQDGWFFSKPVLDFWMQGLAFSLLGVRYLPDQMLAGVEHGLFPQPEWAARFPVFLMTLLAGYLLYKVLALLISRAAGFFAALALVSMPYWYLLARQTMTDMPYVAPLTMGMALLLLAFHTPADRQCRDYCITWRGHCFTLSAHTLLFVSFLLLVIPQILYLLSRNITLHSEPFGFSWPHADTFFSGSGGGNCGLPGNDPCRSGRPVYPLLQPSFLAVVWSVLLLLVVRTHRQERRLQRLYVLGAWLCVALSAMAKGAPGLVVPVFVIGVYVFATKRWKQLLDLELGSAVLISACLILPWYLQMYARHGAPFIERLLMHDMYRRAFLHVHDTNVGDDTSFRYYVWQLGYGVFPWTGLSAVGLLWWLRGRDESQRSSADVATFFGLWFIGAFALFTISLTKFHHYIFPAVPPLAALLGVFLARALGSFPAQSWSTLATKVALNVGSGALVWCGLVLALPGAAFGVALRPSSPALGVVLLLVGAGVWISTQRSAWPAQSPMNGQQHIAISVVGCASALVVLVTGRDFFARVAGDIVGQARLLHLFTYNYARPWPESLDFSAAFIAFTLLAAAACAGLMVARWRIASSVLLCSVALLWTAWGVNVYFVRTAPHWGQRETMLAYYADRKSPSELLVAFEMNWKGENFYTGNRVPAWVQTGAKFREWLTEQKNKGARVMYFTTEHSRLSRLKTEVGKVAEFHVLTDKTVNNKFFLAKVRF